MKNNKNSILYIGGYITIKISNIVYIAYPAKYREKKILFQLISYNDWRGLEDWKDIFEHDNCIILVCPLSLKDEHKILKSAWTSKK